jgi:hypothetical protein
MTEEEYQCKKCGKTVKITGGIYSKCCGKYMKQMTKDICIQPAHAEHARLMEFGDACDGFREG